MQPDEHDLKIELIENREENMDWLKQKPAGDTAEAFLQMQRESGDGDSGAECKESTGNDFLEIKEALTCITREVQGAEKPKDHKKVSRIPVRQNRLKLTSEKNVASLEENKNDNLEKETNEIKYTQEEEEEEFLLLNVESDASDNKKIPDMAYELKDIYQDLNSIPESMKNESEESSLSPRAPLAHAEEESASDECEEETILEAPEEFRSEICGDEMTTRCPDGGKEIELSNAHSTEHSHASNLMTIEKTEEMESPDRCEQTEPEAKTERDNNITDSSNENETEDKELIKVFVADTGRNCDNGNCRTTPTLVTETEGMNEDDDDDGNKTTAASVTKSGSNEKYGGVRDDGDVEGGGNDGDNEGDRGNGGGARLCDAQETLAAVAVVQAASIVAGGGAGGGCGGSRVSAVTVRAATAHNSGAGGYGDDAAGAGPPHHKAADDGRPRSLDWNIENGRLVFNIANDTTEHKCKEFSSVESTCTSPTEPADEPDNATEFLRSRDINKRFAETGSRLKLLETKLKEAAGLYDNNHSDPIKEKTTKIASFSKWSPLNAALGEGSQKSSQEQEQVADKSANGIVLDRNKNECKSDDDVVDPHITDEEFDDDGLEEIYPQIEITELGSPADLDAFLDNRFGGRCEFDVKRISAFSGFGDSEFYLVYDELEDACSSSGEDDAAVNLTTTETMRGDMCASGGGNAEGEAGRKRHNPDHDNLKSLLKKPGRGKDKKNRVSFNENRNEFFDADYIILIREECDYDEDDDDGVCTCNQHEMVRLTCCEPGCSCGYDDAPGPVDATSSGGTGNGPTPQSPKFAPPLEFVDSVTLSPPEGYKDMDLGEQQLIALQQMARHRHQPVCRECSGVHDSDSNSGSDGDENQYIEKAQQKYQQSQTSLDQQSHEEKEKTDQSQQTTPTTPPADCTPVQSRYIMETITMTTVTERRMVREVEDTTPVETTANSAPLAIQGNGSGSPISGILKGGKLWNKQVSVDNPGVNVKGSDNTQMSDASNSITSDEEGNTLTRRSVRFHETESDKRDSCDGEADKGLSPEEADKKSEETTLQEDEDNQNQKEIDNCNNSVSPDATEMMLTFRLGHHVLISNNSLKPNSAVRQLFPCSKPLISKTDEDGSMQQYVVTAESLRAFEEAKKAKLPHILQGDGDDSIKKIIERNTLRRSLIRYEPRSKKQTQKTDNSLVERIKQLTCDVDEPPAEEEEIPPRASPPGEESTKITDNINQLNNRNHDKSFSPSSSSTTSSNSSMSSTYKKITDLFGKREKSVSDAQNNAINESNNKQNLLHTAPDLGNGGAELIDSQQGTLAKLNPTNEARKQFLSTLAPLTACVGGNATNDEFQYQYQVTNNPGERISVASTVGTEYSLEDIDEALKNDSEDSKKVAPDVLVGTPSASESTDELAMFVQQDASRIERIKKRYQPENNTEDDDEHDDYGFNRRPSVRGIKPRFGSTTEILQQIQSQLQPPGNPQPTTQQRQQNHMWPYYSETGLDNPKTRTCPQGYNHQPYSFPTEDIKSRTIGQQYRPTSLIEENIYQNCPNQRCTQLHYGPNINHVHPPIMRIGGGCSELYQTLPSRPRSGRPESPPPMEMSRSYHQTMVLIPYNRIESIQPENLSPNPFYATAEQCSYARYATNKKYPSNVVNKRYPEPIYHGTLPSRVSHPHVDDPQYQLKLNQKQMIRVPYSTGQPVQVHLMASRSESPLPGQFATARATQTPTATLSSCNYYNPGPPNARYRPAIGPNVPHNGWHTDPYATKINRHSFPIGGHRYPMPDNISLADSDSQHSTQLPNGFRNSALDSQLPPGSPTKTRFTSERGVPEGAASVSPQDSITTAQNSSTMTSPTSPQNPPVQGTNGKPLYYAMNV